MQFYPSIGHKGGYLTGYFADPDKILKPLSSYLTYYRGAIRYIHFYGSPPRLQPDFKIKTHTYLYLSDLLTLAQFKDLTIIEITQAITDADQSAIEALAQYIKEQAIRSRGVIFLGNAWVDSLEEIEPYFDRLVIIKEILPANIRDSNAKNVSKQVTLAI